MVVEDEFLIKMVLADEFRDAGYQVIGVSSADEALEVLQGDFRPDGRMRGSLDVLGLLKGVR